MKNLTELIKKQAIAIGFDLVGITDASPISDKQADYLKNWLQKGYAAGMAYMHKNLEKRINPALLLEAAKSVICVGLNYKPEKDTRQSSRNVATYACYQDYHEFIKKNLFLLAEFIKTVAANDFKFKVCVDSAPLAERSLAARAGLGFIAKNRMLTNPVLGQKLLLGELLTNIELKPDQSLANECLNCEKCIRACPTGAFSPDGTLDASKCISYLTIEHKDTIPEGLAKKIGSRFFGCDECVRACRRQKDAPAAANKDFKFRDDLQSLDLPHILEMDEEQLKKVFADSPLIRLGSDRLKRNAVIALLNNQNSAHGATKSSFSEVGTSTPR